MNIFERQIPRYSIEDMSDIEFRCLKHIVDFYIRHETTNTQEMEITAKKLQTKINAKLGDYPR